MNGYMCTTEIHEGTFLGHDGQRIWLREYGNGFTTYFRHVHASPEAMTRNYNGKAARITIDMQDGSCTLMFI